MVACNNSDGPEGPVIPYDSFVKPADVGNNIVAHRGAYKEFGLPDNSVASLKKAIELKCYASECDIQITGDGKVIIFHDDAFKGAYVHETSYADLCALGTLANGEKIPLLEEYLDVAMEGGCTRLWLDVKSKSVSTLTTNQNNGYSSAAGVAAAAVIRAKKARYFTEFIVGRQAVYNKCIAATLGDWATAYMGALDPTSFAQSGFSWSNMEISSLETNPTWVQGFKDKGLKISTYNADTEAQMIKYISAGIYGVCTNYPQKALEIYTSLKR